MPAPSAICLVIDRLQSGMLGPFGNTWIRTPHFDQLAATSFVFDRAVADSPDLSRIYNAYWCGMHALTMASGDRPTLPGKLRKAGIHTVLVTDAADVARHPAAADFDVRVVVPTTTVQHLAPEVEQTEIARLLAVAADQLATSGAPFLLWIHAATLDHAWDAPYDLRAQYADDDDPRPPDSSHPPCGRLPPDADPDSRLAVMHSYAGQVSALDECLGPFVEQVSSIPAAAQALLTLVSPRGYPLGEHGLIGTQEEALYCELVQVPWLVRLPEGRGAAARSPSIVQPAQLHGLLCEWFGVSAESAWAWSPLCKVQGQECGFSIDHAVCIGRGTERSIATPAWYLRQPGISPNSAGNPPPELYAKPDDRFEVNDLATRCPEIVDGLVAYLDQFTRAAISATGGPLPVLATEFLERSD